MTNNDLLKYAKLMKIPYFRGVFMRDNLPRKIRTNETGIVNLDNQEGEGTHWTSYIKRGKNIRYFDSIGRLKPPLEVIQYFRTGGSNSNIQYNFDKYQSFNSHNCGQQSLKFLYTYGMTNSFPV